MSSSRNAELVHWLGISNKKNFIPACADIDLTNICNQGCFYCSTSVFRNSHPVWQTKDHYINLITKLATWREYQPNSIGTFSTVIFSGGGEPTLLKGYEQVIEHTIDQNILPSLITNGSHLDRLIDNVSIDKIRKMLYIGIDIDAGTNDLYEEIRRSKTANTFDRVITNIKELAPRSNNVDLKVVLSEKNTTRPALADLMVMAKDLKVRQVYFRPLYIIDPQYVFPITDYIELINELAFTHGVKVRINTSRFLARNYSKCHQMFLFPVFCADGNVYVCCENKGDPAFKLGSWVDNDFRDLWGSTEHISVYNRIDTNECHQCRSNIHNIDIQNVINDPQKLESLMI